MPYSGWWRFFFINENSIVFEFQFWIRNIVTSIFNQLIDKYWSPFKTTKMKDKAFSIWKSIKPHQFYNFFGRKTIYFNWIINPQPIFQRNCKDHRTRIRSQQSTISENLGSSSKIRNAISRIGIWNCGVFVLGDNDCCKVEWWVSGGFTLGSHVCPQTMRLSCAIINTITTTYTTPLLLLSLLQKGRRTGPGSWRGGDQIGPEH